MLSRFRLMTTIKFNSVPLEAIDDDVPTAKVDRIKAVIGEMRSIEGEEDE